MGRELARKHDLNFSVSGLTFYSSTFEPPQPALKLPALMYLAKEVKHGEAGRGSCASTQEYMHPRIRVRTPSNTQ